MQTIAIPFVNIGNKQFLSYAVIKQLQLERFVEEFKNCFDFHEAAIEGRRGAYFYPEGKLSDD